MTGRFITLEGGEGAGKSTQALRLADWLAASGITVEVTREPGGTSGAEAIRKLLVSGETGKWDPIAETLLHYAARREHVSRRIQPALEAGRWVICDRFFDSTLAYQGYGQGVELGTITTIRLASLGDFKPDLTLVLDVSPQTRRERILGRPGGLDRYERMDEDFHARVRKGFAAIAMQESERCKIVSADHGVEEVAAALQNAVRTAFGL